MNNFVKILKMVVYSSARCDDIHANDASEASVGSCALATKAGACLRPKAEFAQEPECISECSE